MQTATAANTAFKGLKSQAIVPKTSSSRHSRECLSEKDLCYVQEAFPLNLDNLKCVNCIVTHRPQVDKDSKEPASRHDQTLRKWMARPAQPI